MLEDPSFPILLEDTIVLRDTRYICLAGLVILLYDVLLTLDAEVKYVWSMLKSPHTLVSIMFIANRYGNIVLLAVLNAQFMGLWPSGRPTHQFCESFTITTNLLIFIALASINAGVPVRRAWFTLAGARQFKVAKCLAAAYGAYFVGSAGLLLYGSLMDHEHLAVHGTCVNHLPRWLNKWLFWLPSIVLNTVAFTMSIIRLHEHVKGVNASSIIRTAYGDGMLYYFISVAFDVWNILYWALGSSRYRHTLSLASTLATMTILSQRLVIRLRTSDDFDYNTDHTAGACSTDFEITTGDRPVSPLVFSEVLPKQTRAPPPCSRAWRWPASRNQARLSHISEEVEMSIRSES
ncbi:hypothetical protein OE88DRAFT_1738984 [Heliocybe sulcata]|uniref:DUF6533 domain-containing protein n=1 Tax=Heliocybe sulcata TaxID=5364 RepID=A0A5C3MT39_9AGAM|nr:hypothetical protein OE88DRAFT_1738984 [Heliocybe sulcata]